MVVIVSKTVINLQMSLVLPCVSDRDVFHCAEMQAFWDRWRQEGQGYLALLDDLSGVLLSWNWKVWNRVYFVSLLGNIWDFSPEYEIWYLQFPPWLIVALHIPEYRTCVLQRYTWSKIANFQWGSLWFWEIFCASGNISPGVRVTLFCCLTLQAFALKMPYVALIHLGIIVS